MNRFRRWTVSIGAHFDELLGQVENHEALAQQALVEMRKNLAQAERQYQKVQRDGSRLKEEAEKARRDEQGWRKRAQGEDGEERALECIRRSRACAKRAEVLEEQVAEQEKMRAQLRTTISSLEEKFRLLKNKKQLLSTRAAAGRAARAVEGECESSDMLDDVFERWEDSLVEGEFRVSPLETGPDELEKGYQDEEERASLLKELEALRALPEEGAFG